MLQPDDAAVFSVSQAARYVKDLLQIDDVLQSLWVRGEISDCKTYPSGHCYFTLKDDSSQLSCVFFKNARLRSASPELRNGMALLVAGHVSFYERDGKLQLYVDYAEPLGEGALFRRFEQLKERLAAEGLFDEERKRPLPAQPTIVGIVTSLQAAALRDMLRVLHMRYPLAQVILAPTLVQGEEAPAAIAAALDRLNEYGEADVIIVARGGGSREELWAFNEEVVARAIARSRIPVISGVGHETDFTIADFVADYRASTPTAAATAAVPDIADWQQSLEMRTAELEALIENRLEFLRDRVARASRDLAYTSPQGQLDRRRQQLDDLTGRLQGQIDHLLSLRGERLSGMALRLDALSPLKTIARGFAVVRRDSDQALIKSVRQVRQGDRLTVEVADGQIPVEVAQLEAFAGGEY